MDKTCCFIGHREMKESEELEQKVYSIVEKLILQEKVDTFLFGSKSRFNSLCLEVVTKIKEKHPHIKRVYVRAEYPIINDDYRKYLLKSYEDTYYSKAAEGAGRAVYIKRNCEMIEKSEFCVFYYCEENLPKKRKSGTKSAFDYAVKKKKKIIHLP